MSACQSCGTALAPALAFVSPVGHQQNAGRMFLCRQSKVRVGSLSRLPPERLE